MARCVESRSHDPYANLALEACLVRAARAGEPTLLIWQNERTVVIGRNQYASAECDVELLSRDGGRLARRRSGGGAVYHDLGNLNVSFVAAKGEYDQTAQTEVMLDAVRSLGVDAQRTGRNDLVVAGGRKFSGHAYYHAGAASCHHATIMVDVDLALLGRYLTVSPDKLAAKGVRSVRSRVTNLAELRPGVTVTDLKEAVRSAFSRHVGGALAHLDPNVLDAAELEEERRRFAAREWLFRGERGAADGDDDEGVVERLEARFAWGGVRAELLCAGGVIRELAVFSDALDGADIDAVPGLLIGAKRDRDELLARLRAGGVAQQMSADLASLLGT